MSTLAINHRLVLALRWTARVLGSLLFLFWGAFFVEHLAWFLHPGVWPPPEVFFYQGLHLLMLVGLLVAWKWEVVGSLLLVGGAVPFFWHAAGRNALLFTSITCVPALLWLAVAWYERRLERSK